MLNYNIFQHARKTNYQKNNMFYFYFIGILLFYFSSNLQAKQFNQVTICIGKTANSVEMNIAELLSERLMENGLSDVKITAENNNIELSTNRLIILLTSILVF